LRGHAFKTNTIVEHLNFAEKYGMYYYREVVDEFPSSEKYRT